jgi:hypothetical protein
VEENPVVFYKVPFVGIHLPDWIWGMKTSGDTQGEIGIVVIRKPV